MPLPPADAAIVAELQVPLTELRALRALTALREFMVLVFNDDNHTEACLSPKGRRLLMALIRQSWELDPDMQSEGPHRDALNDLYCAAADFVAAHDFRPHTLDD